MEHACVFLPDDQGLVFSNGLNTQSADMSKLTQSIGQMKGGFQGVASQTDEDRLTFASFKAALEINLHDDSIYYWTLDKIVFP